MRRLLLLIALAAPACYNYSGVTFDQLQPGMEVRAHITGAGLDRIRRVPGQGAFDRLELTGEVVEVGRDTLFLGVPLSTFDGAGGSTELVKPVPLARVELLGTDERHLNKQKTWIAIGVGAFATTFIIYRMRGGGLITPREGVVTPPENRIPLFPRNPLRP